MPRTTKPPVTLPHPLPDGTELISRSGVHITVYTAGETRNGEECYNIVMHGNQNISGWTHSESVECSIARPFSFLVKAGCRLASTRTRRKKCNA